MAVATATISPRSGMDSATPTCTMVVAFARCVLSHGCAVFDATQGAAVGTGAAVGASDGWSRAARTMSATTAVCAASGISMMPSSSRLTGSGGGEWGIVRTTVTTIAMRLATITRRVSTLPRRVMVRGTRTGSYIPDTPGTQG